MKEVKCLNKLMANKKCMIPLTLIFVAIILMIPLANAIPITYAYVDTVTSSYGVSYPDRVKSLDGSYAIFDGLDSKIVVKTTVTGPSGAAVQIYGYAFSGSLYVQCWSGPSPTGPWTQIGWGTYIDGNLGWDPVGTLPGNHQYIAIANAGGSLYVDQIKIQY